MNSNWIAGIAVAILSGILWFGYQEITSLSAANAELTLKLESAIKTLDKVVEYSEKVNDVTARLELADAARTKQLRGFERNLSALAKTSQEYRDLLSIIIPDDMLTGLRSFQATERPGVSKQNP